MLKQSTHYLVNSLIPSVKKAIIIIFTVVIAAVVLICISSTGFYKRREIRQKVRNN